jgi:hypothetical protein
MTHNYTTCKNNLVALFRAEMKTLVLDTGHRNPVREGAVFVRAIDL